jgi:hypothetical protein
MKMPDLQGLPGAERVQQGLADLQAGRRSVEALWLAAAATRLRFLGLPVPAAPKLPKEPEIGLYAALGTESEDPYYRYNALRAELDSFLEGLEARVGRTRERKVTF